MYKELINNTEIQFMLERMSSQILEVCADYKELCIIGVQRRGIYIADALAKLIIAASGKTIMLGSLDITFYRDDLSKISEFPTVYGTVIDFDINDKLVILVDDVVYTGRTAKAALDTVMDYGRPEKVMYVTLVDRGHRELPLQPDFVGRVIPTSKKELIHVKVKEIDNIDSIGIDDGI